MSVCSFRISVMAGRGNPQPCGAVAWRYAKKEVDGDGSVLLQGGVFQSKTGNRSWLVATGTSTFLSMKDWECHHPN